LDQVIQLDPKNAAAFNSRGLGYAAKGDYDRAIVDWIRRSGSIQKMRQATLAAAPRGSRRVRLIKH